MQQDATNYADAPIGAVIAFAGEKDQIPSNWLVCEGQTLEVKDYRLLFSAIGKSWGYKELGGDTFFNLPNLQGMFLRGVSGSSKVDPDAAQRSSQGEGGNKGNNVGSIQQDAFKTHTHDLKLGQGYDAGDGSSTYARNDTGFDHSSQGVQQTGGNETRPVNAYVFYIIKAC